MLTKTQVIESFKDLPEEISADDLIERILFLREIEKSMEEAGQGKVTSHEQIKREAREWIKK